MANTPKIRAEGFNRRAGKFIDALYSGLNGETFVSLDQISNPLVADEFPEHKTRTAEILAQMGYVEIQVDANGVTTYRLTPSGVVQKSVRVGEGL